MEFSFQLSIWFVNFVFFFVFLWENRPLSHAIYLIYRTFQVEGQKFSAKSANSRMVYVFILMNAATE
jgi:hypothetical protein